MWNSLPQVHANQHLKLLKGLPWKVYYVFVLFLLFVAFLYYSCVYTAFFQFNLFGIKCTNLPRNNLQKKVSTAYKLIKTKKMTKHI